MTDRGLNKAAVENMSLEALAAAVTPAEDDADAESLLEGLRQQPETGGESSENLADEIKNEPEGIEALNATGVNEVRERFETAARMESRTPRYAEDLRQEVVDMVPGVTNVEEINLDGV